MKKKYWFILIGKLIIILWFLIFFKLYKQSETQMQINQYPTFRFTTITNDSLTSNNIYNLNKVVIIIYYHSDCEYCIQQIENIEKRLTEFNNIFLVFVSDEPQKNINLFIENHKILNNKNIAICSCDYIKMYEWFGDLSAPTIFIYNKNGILQKKYNGITRVDDILTIAKNEPKQRAKNNKTTR